MKKLPPVTVARIVDHIDHIVKLVGIDHVGIGSDFDGVQATTSDLSTVADLPNLTKELLKRGYSESDVDKILGGNMLRVMEEQVGLDAADQLRRLPGQPAVGDGHGEVGHAQGVPARAPRLGRSGTKPAAV